ncbi:MAG: alpha/beta hydrolase, partial [Thermoanaerobaculia bacterium]|nr:alpha/beta hydrolase [Thermoanaerobaculia bacterium]
MKRTFRILSLALLLALVLPVLAQQLGGEEESRRFEFVRLEETSYREVRFRNAEQDLELAGLLFVPEGDGPFPAAVVIHGSGTSRRDNGWYLTLVDHLQASGIVVLLPDKRGSVESEGDWATASLEDLATDSAAAVSFVRQQEEVPVASIGLIGMSQGGKIAPLVATRHAEVDWIVDVVGGALPMHESLVYEETHNLRQMGVLPGLSDVIARLSAWSIVHLRQKEFWDAVGNFDPLPYWRDLSVPALVLYGGNDTNVATQRSAPPLRAGDRPNQDVRK